MEWRYFVDANNGKLWESDGGAEKPIQAVDTKPITDSPLPPVFYPLPYLAVPGDWLYDEASNFIFRWDGGLTFKEDGCVLTGDHGGTLDEPQAFEKRAWHGQPELAVSMLADGTVDIAPRSTIERYLADMAGFCPSQVDYDIDTDKLYLNPSGHLLYEKGIWIEVSESYTGTPPQHYDLSIQPQEYIKQNGLGWDDGNVIKYVTRYRHKGGQADLRKALDYLHKLLQEYEDPQNPA